MRAIRDMFSGPIFNDYERYLIERGRLKKANKDYSKLFRVLLQSPYFYSIHGDENREKDALAIRRDFLYDSKIPCQESDWSEASIFEVILAISERVTNEYIGDPSDLHPEIFFMDIIKNLKLDTFDNKHMNMREIDRRLDHFVENIFPNTDLNGEIWYRLKKYLTDNYYNR